MRAKRIVTEGTTAELFDAAVESSALAVVTLQDENLEWTSFKCRFLERDAQQKFFVLDHEPFQGATLPRLQLGQYVGVSFRHKSRKILLATVVEARGRFAISKNETIQATRYRWPESMTEMQRRAYYRTPVPEDTEVAVNLWPGGPEHRTAAMSGKLPLLGGRLQDISCGGALIQLGKSAPADWSEEMTFGVELHLPDNKAPLQLTATSRGVRADNRNELAVQFIGLELQLDGRQILQRISRCIQQFHRATLAPQLRSGERRLKL